MTFIATQIRDAIRREMGEIPRYCSFEVRQVLPAAEGWSLRLRSIYPQQLLNETMEGNTLTWCDANGEKYFSEVADVLLESYAVLIRSCDESTPVVGDQVRIENTNFLEVLAEYWDNPDCIKASEQWTNEVTHNNVVDDTPLVKQPRFPGLRPGQMKALAIPRAKCGYLWGPPGTGKTFTLGVMIAEFMLQHPGKRVLLVSTSNAAVDQALIAVDKSLDTLRKNSLYPPHTFETARVCRYGMSASLSVFDGREHLLPLSMESVEVLQALKARPPTEDNIDWVHTKQRIRDEAKTLSKKALSGASLVAMTTYAALKQRDAIPQSEFDLVVFDEASQISIAQAWAIAPVGSTCLFAGDPRQLGPITQSRDTNVNEYLARSMFHLMEGTLRGGYTGVGSVEQVMSILNEQSRMSNDISDLVSDLFYQDVGLRVADQSTADPQWLADRKTLPLRLDEQNPEQTSWPALVSLEVDQFSNTSGLSNVREDSARHCVRIAKEALRGGYADKLMILTPFRNQRDFIRRLLRQHRCGAIRVSTVHPSQGSEYHTLVFDPVNATGHFMRASKGSRRLLNVALSRAQAQVIMLLSEQDRCNPLYHHFHQRAQRLMELSQ